MKETPRSFSLQPVISLSGSDQSKSQSRPQSGIYSTISIEPTTTYIRTYICRTHNATYLFHRVKIWTQPTVHGEDLLVNDSSDWQTIEAIGKGLPQLDVIPSLTLIVEPIDTINGCTLMVTTKNEEVLWVFDLVCKEQTDCLERLLASINIISQKEIVCLWWEASIFEES